MRNSNDIRVLRDRALQDLANAHDYYVDTRAAWRVVRSAVQAGRVVNVRNAATGTATTGIDLAAKSRGYMARELAEASFQQFHSIFEDFVLQFLRNWLADHPQSLASKQIEIQMLLEFDDIRSAIIHVADKEADRVLRLVPADWFVSLDKLVKLGCPTQDEVDQFVEARATRDVLVHNGGIVGKVYTTKSGTRSRYANGRRVQVGEAYHRATWELFRKIVADVSDAAAAKIA